MAGGTFLAFDLGAESGRALLGSFDGGQVSLREVHRFPNTPVQVAGELRWDVPGIFQEIKEGLALVAREGERPESVGVDSWGVDFALLDRNGKLLSNPCHYRDPRTEGILEEVSGRVSRAEIYGATGIQFMRINTLPQLLAMEGSPLLEAADTLLLIPDLMCYWLTGEKLCEYTNATTTQLYSTEGDWAWGIIERMGLPGRIFPGVVPPAAEIGPLLPGVAEETGLGEVPVTAVASHDTASAVVAVPAERESFAYISSGTWSLVGVEAPRPILTEEAMEANFTNEGGFGGRTRFLKNVMGLWILQECQRTWAREGRDYSYEELVRLAEEALSGPLVDPDHEAFLPPGDMPSRIRSFCEASGQAPPESVGALVRCVLESLALKYRWVLEQAGSLTGQGIEAVHVVGGGSRNELLCRLTAEAARLPVLAGPVEATAIGNVMVQTYAGGCVGSLEEIRAVVRRSFEVRTYTPEDETGQWDELYGRFLKVLEAAPGLIRGGESV